MLPVKDDSIAELRSSLSPVMPNLNEYVLSAATPNSSNNVNFAEVVLAPDSADPNSRWIIQEYNSNLYIINYGQPLGGETGGYGWFEKPKIVISTDGNVYTEAEAISIAMHEAGHTLFLAHPDKTRKEYKPVSVMNSSASDNTTYPTLYDEYNLKKVWG